MTASTVYSASLPLEQFPYVGWVPTVNGQLSFRHVGEGRSPTASIYANITTELNRFVLAYQMRPLSDVLFQSVIHYVCSISGKFWFVLAAKTRERPGETDELIGLIGIYKSREDWRGNAESSVRGAIKHLNEELRFSLEPIRDRTIETTFIEADRGIAETTDIQIAFHLFRNGKVFFSKPAFRNSELEYASRNYAESCGHDFARWIADQCYFFLRDIAHRHQHHTPTSDTILILQKRDREDLQWRKNIIFSLYYFIIRSRRFSDLTSLYQSLGVQAYAMAFKSICEDELHERFREVPSYKDAALAQSISARAEEERARRSDSSRMATLKLARAANWRTFALAIVAIVIATLALLIQPRINDSDRQRFPQLNQFSDYAAEHFLTVLGTCLVLIFLVWVGTRAGWTARSSWTRDLLEVSNVKRRRFAFIYAGAGVLVALATFWVAKLALRDIWEAILDFWRLAA
jgi:hypothetical protein